MDSTQLEKIVSGLSNWFTFNEQVLEKVPAKKGVYVIRLTGARKIGRLNGESDIMYIGSNESEGGLGQRLFHYFHPGPTQWTNRRVHVLSKKYSMEIAWSVCSDAVNLESRLLNEYFKDHDELPPINHADVRRFRALGSAGISFNGKAKVMLVKGKPN
jgi:hypothetical protein